MRAILKSPNARIQKEAAYVRQAVHAHYHQGHELRNRIIMPAVQQESDGEAVFTLTFDNARLWTPETPNLYTCRVSFADDEVTETFGIRKVE